MKTIRQPSPLHESSSLSDILSQTHTHTHISILLLPPHPFNGLFSRTTWVSRYQKGKTSPDLSDARDDRVLGCSGISWIICKQSASRSRQITTTTPHQSVFTGRMLFLTTNQQCQSTEGNKYHTTHTSYVISYQYITLILMQGFATTL